MGSGGLALRGVQISGVYLIIVATLLFMFTLVISEHNALLGTTTSESLTYQGSFQPNNQVNSTLPGSTDADIPAARSILKDFYSIMFFNVSLNTQQDTFMEWFWIIRLFIVYIPLMIFIMSIVALVWI